MNVRIEEPFFLKQLDNLSKVKTRIYFGYPGGNAYSEIAKDLSMGVAGPVTYKSTHFKDKEITVQGVPERNFLVDGYMYIEKSVDEKVGELWKELFTRGVVSEEKLGSFIVSELKNWVYTNPYQDDVPNSERVVEDKGKNFPLIDSGGMINAMQFVVTNRMKG